MLHKHKKRSYKPTHHKHKSCFHVRLTWFILVAMLFLALLRNLHATPVDAFFDGLKSLTISKPKPITQSKTSLPSFVQQAVANLAHEQVKQEQAKTVLTTAQSQSTSVQSQSIIQPVINAVQEAITIDPGEKAQLKLADNDGMIQQLQHLLQNNASDEAVDQAVAVIANIGYRSDKVAADKSVQTDRTIIKRQIEQYNRLQLVLQKLEDQLPIKAYFKIEDARVKYLVSGAQKSLNAAPNLDVVHNIALPEVKKLVGDDFAQLKAIEVLSDIENGLNPRTQQKLLGLEKQIALEFEKKILKLPQAARDRKLQEYVNYSFGNSISQIHALNRMKSFMSDRSVVLGIEAVKELTFKKLEDRIFQLDSQAAINTFLDKELGRPEDLKILTQLRLNILSGSDEGKKKRFLTMQSQAQQKLEEFFSKDQSAISNLFAKDPSTNVDLLDISLISNLNQMLSTSPNVAPQAKEALKAIKAKILKNLVQTVSNASFVTRSKATYNPVPANADVRILLPDAQALQLLEEMKQELSPSDRSKLEIAENVETSLVSEHLLIQVNDPATFKEDQAFIAANPQIKRILQQKLGPRFFAALSQKDKVLEDLAKKQDQALYEKMQQLIQQVFITKDKTQLEQQLPTEVQQEITKLKEELPDRAIPKIEIPSDVKLPQVATLPNTVQQAIIQAAKDQIKDKNISKEAKLDLTIQAKDLGVAEPTILPGSLFYPLKELVQDVVIVLTADPITKAQKLIKRDNEKTLEAAKLIEENQSQKTIKTALETLNSVSSDFNLLKKHVNDLKTLEQTQPEKVDMLVNQIIENGLARQTVLSAIEDKVHGDDYVAVEKVRSDILKDGINTLLQLKDNNAQKLTYKLETAVSKEAGSQLKDIKAVELLTEIARTQAPDVQQVLAKSESNLAANLETKLLQIPKEQRTKEVLDYAKSESGNPVRQLEAAEVLKDNFTSPETIALTEGVKDVAVNNLKERISEIPDAASRVAFVEQVIGDKPQDLKIAIEIEDRVEPAQNAGAVETLPIVQQVEDIKAAVEQNIIDTYKDKPQELAQTDFFKNNPTPDVTDIQTAKDLTTALERPPEVAANVVSVAKQEETKINDTFVENISSSQFQVSVSASAQTNVTELAAQTLNPIPEALSQLIDLKSQVLPAQQAKIDIAIKAQATLIEDHLITQVNDPATFQSYTAQITENPTVAAAVAQVGGQAFTQAVQEKTQAIDQQATSDQTKLETTVAQIQQEVFSNTTSVSAPVVATLPATVQQQVEQIKQEVPAAQIPQVNVEAQAAQSTTITVTAPAPAAESQAAQTPSAPAPQQSAPAPAAPEVKPPEQTAPAVPGL